MRICHYIKPNSRSETPTRAIWLQAWTYPLRKEGSETIFDFEFFRMCRGVKDTGTGEWSFTWATCNTVEAIWEWFDAWTVAKTKTYILCQNTSLHLPLMGAFQESLAHGWKLTLAVIPPAPTICRWRKDQKTIVLLAISNIWPTPSVHSLTGRLTSYDYAKSGEFQECEHVKRVDAEVIRIRTMTLEWWAFLKKNDFGGFSPTAGAQSVRVWRHKFMTHKVLIDCHDEALELSRSGIFGARCEVYKYGHVEGPVYELDTNGAYGGIMRDMPVPVKLRGYRRHADVRDLCEWVREGVVVARVSIDTEIPVYPLRDDGRLSFRTGQFTTVLCGDELKYALDRGDVVDVHECVVYEAQPAFSAYMQALWNLRMLSESNGLVQDAAKYKLLMASFFGRWAQRGWIWEKCGDAEDQRVRSWVNVDAQTREITEYRQFGGIVQKLNNEAESRESHPAIAACVLAGARMQLWRFINVAGLEHVYYCDTDSIFTDEVGFQRLRMDIEPKVLGRLKCKAIYNRVTIHGPKYLTVDGVIRHAGVGECAVYADHGRVDQVQSRHVSDWIRSGLDPKAGCRETHKTFKAEGRHGV